MKEFREKKKNFSGIMIVLDRNVQHFSFGEGPHPLLWSS